MTLKRTPMARPSGAELVHRIAGETEGLPPTRGGARSLNAQAASATPDQQARSQLTSTATEQINFRGSPGLARLLAQLAAEQGSIRIVIARLLKANGLDVPDTDLAPPPGRRRI